MAKVKATAEKVDKRISTLPDKKLGILNYDFDNRYPQRVEDITNDSGTAKTCLRLFAKFVMGGGAADKDFYKTRINSDGLTVDKLVRLVAEDKGFGHFAVHFNYNGVGKLVDASFIPWVQVRLVSDPESEHYGKIAIHPDWDLRTGKYKLIRKEDITFINVFNPFSVQSEIEATEGGIENYKGQVYYWSKTGITNYSLVPFDAVLEDMQTEAQTKRFKHQTASKNFLASHLLITGKEEEIEGENSSDEFAQLLTSFQGGDGAGSMLWLERENNDEQIELKKVDIQSYDGLYEFTENSSRDSIIRQFLIPPVLLIKNESAFSSDQIADAFDYYNGITADDRLVIEEFLKDAFSNWYKDICPTGDYSLLPLKYKKAISSDYFPYYTKNEIRVSNGDEAADDAKSDVTVLAVTLGVGGTQSLTALVSDPLLSIEQKKGSMKVLFGLTEDQANQMLGLNTPTP